MRFGGKLKFEKVSLSHLLLLHRVAICNRLCIVTSVYRGCKSNGHDTRLSINTLPVGSTDNVMHQLHCTETLKFQSTSREQIGSIATYSLYLDDKRFFSSYSALSFYKFIRFRSRLRIIQRSATLNDAHLSSEKNSQRSNCWHAKISIASYIKHSTVSCAEVNVLQ